MIVLISGSNLGKVEDISTAGKLPQNTHRRLSSIGDLDSTQHLILEWILLLNGCGFVAQSWLKYSDLTILV